MELTVKDFMQRTGLSQSETSAILNFLVRTRLVTTKKEHRDGRKRQVYVFSAVVRF